jgi:hypothetical protein
LVILVAGTAGITSACSSGHGVPSHADTGADTQVDTGADTQADTGIDTQADTGADTNGDSGLCSEGLTRAPAGDAVCNGVAECFVSQGQPDHQGCPNTCSCVCSSGQCFAHACTAIAGCTEPNTYR